MVSPRRSRFTSRAAVLACVLAGLVIALAYPTRQYVAQRGQISDEAHQVRQSTRQVKQLRREKARWQDAAYVQAQARSRLHFVKPGETAFLFPQGGTVRHTSTRVHGPRSEPQPWYRNLWNSVDAADRSTSPPESPHAARSRTP